MHIATRIFKIGKVYFILLNTHTHTPLCTVAYCCVTFSPHPFILLRKAVASCCAVLLSNCANIYFKMSLNVSLNAHTFHFIPSRNSKKFFIRCINSSAFVTINSFFVCEQNMKLKRGDGKLFMSNYFHIFYGHKFYSNNKIFIHNFVHAICLFEYNLIT